MSQGLDPKQNSFVQHFGSEALDASNLMMPLMLFVSPTDPRMHRHHRPHPRESHQR